MRLTVALALLATFASAMASPGKVTIACFVVSVVFAALFIVAGDHDDSDIPAL